MLTLPSNLWTWLQTALKILMYVILMRVIAGLLAIKRVYIVKTHSGINNMDDGLKIVSIEEHEPHESGGIQWGRHTVWMQFPKTPWYKRLFITLQMWWYS